MDGISQDVPCAVLTKETARSILMAEEQQFLLKTYLSKVSWFSQEVVCRDTFLISCWPTEACSVSLLFYMLAVSNLIARINSVVFCISEGIT